MSLLHPWFLLLLIPLPALWYWPRRSRNHVHTLVRVFALAALILGLARPISIRPDMTMHHVVIVDDSASIDDAARREAWDLARHLVERRDRNVTVSLVHVGPTGDGGPDTGLSDDVRTKIQIQPGAGASSLSSALHSAAALIPEEARGAVTIVSDGLTTDRNWSAAVMALQQRRIPVHVLRLPAQNGDVRPVGVEALGELRVGESARVRVDVYGASETCDIILDSDQVELARAKLTPRTGDVASVMIEFEPEEAGFISAEIEVIASHDSDPRNNTRPAVFAVQDPRRALYLGGRMTGAIDSLRNLVGRGFQIDDYDTTDPSSRQPRDYDLIIVDDRPIENLPPALQESIVSAVRDDGAGLLVAGGEAAFGPGGWHNSTLASVLPVELLQKEEKRDPSTTLVVIIDTSGSMSGTRVQLAKEVARLAIHRLLPHDKVGIVEFYGAKRWAAPIQPASNQIELERALNRLDAGGGTIILPAIEEAFYGMQNVRTRYKHVLVLTDGGVEAGAFEPLMRRMADKGINVSTVLVGNPSHSEFLVTLANWGKGRYFSVPNRFNMPEVLLKQPATAKLPAYLPGVHQVRARGGRGWWGGVNRSALPTLAGYVESRAKPGAEVLLETADAAHPIVATWRWGLGRVTAVMTEPTGPGTEAWRDWSDYGAWLARLMSRTSSDHRNPFAFELERMLGELRITATRQRPGVHRPFAEILHEGKAPARVEFRRRSRDVYTASVVVGPRDEIRLQAGALNHPEQIYRLVSPPDQEISPELQVDPRRALDLERLSAATGGRVLDIGDVNPVVAFGGAGSAIAIRKLWPIALLIALALYICDLFWRRRAR